MTSSGSVTVSFIAKAEVVTVSYRTYIQKESKEISSKTEYCFLKRKNQVVSLYKSILNFEMERVGKSQMFNVDKDSIVSFIVRY